MSVINKEDMLDIKIFVTAMLFQELLDETGGKSHYILRMRKNIRKLSKELDVLLDENINSDMLSLILTDAAQALEDSINQYEIELSEG